MHTANSSTFLSRKLRSGLLASNLYAPLLVMAQRGHRVDPRSSARGDVCRQYRNREDGHWDKDVEAWLAKAEPIEYGAENLRQRQRHHQSNGPSDRSHFHTFPQNHAQHFRASGSQRHAYADFVRSLARGISD